MNELPEAWERAALGELCEINPPMSKADLSDSEVVSFVPMAAVAEESGSIDTSNVRPARELKRKSYRQFINGDVLVAKITPSMENGKGAVARGLAGGRGFGSTEFHVLRPRPGVSAEYVMRFVLQRCFRAEAARHMTGTAGQLRVPARYLAERTIPVPPTAEQERIVAAIQEQFSRLGAARHACEAARLRSHQLRAAAIDRALSGDWPSKSLADVTEYQTYGSSAKATADPAEGVPIVRMGNIRYGRVDLSVDVKFLPRNHPDAPKFALRRGDLLFNRTNSPDLVGKSAVFTGEDGLACFASYLIRVRLADACDPRWAALFLNSPAGRRWAASVRTQQVGQANINGTKLAALMLPLPPVDEQARRLDEYERQLTIIEALSASIDRVLARSDHLRSTILARAFSGSLVQQDLTDDPASDLLARIAAERADAPKSPPRRRT